ncbi:hypothetical protein KOR42_26630 [Thalassoglobus neptunius]|uniref:Uncharacterized protein n=1 Tax=Thalassoglobus neptunius TaxID=1938619 RepID=A0A5C5X0X0_9PLAN|nr:hypothetical protein [Thalassoglobus neptunius]TWT55852.1 hypothetical protein KOR42_26630 [Thalassoglobus neptunius]
MKTLYLPVFWCGFSLSVSALYLSSEKLSLGQDGTRPPVLMQIDPSIQLQQPSVPPPTSDDTLKPIPSLPPANTEDLQWQQKVDSFISAAQEALN